MEDRNANALILLEKHEIENLIEFFDLNFIDHVREDTEIDNMGYIVSMSGIYAKLETALKEAEEFAKLDFDKIPDEDIIDIKDREEAVNV